jgi:uncharacterized Fe-S cluster-containing protein
VGVPVAAFVQGVELLTPIVKLREVVRQTFCIHSIYSCTQTLYLLFDGVSLRIRVVVEALQHFADWLARARILHGLLVVPIRTDRFRNP